MVPPHVLIDLALTWTRAAVVSEGGRLPQAKFPRTGDLARIFFFVSGHGAPLLRDFD